MIKGISAKYDLNKHRRTYRDMDKLTIISHTDVLSHRVLLSSIEKNKKELQFLNRQIRSMNNKFVKSENKEFVQRLTTVINNLDEFYGTINDHKTKIGHMKSQILRVENELEKYSTVDTRPSAVKTIATLENRLMHSNQKKDSLRMKAILLTDMVKDLLLMRRRFQTTRNRVVHRLMQRKTEINQLVDVYTIAFLSGMKTCQDIEKCHLQSAKQLQDHLQEMRQWIRAAESNDILQEFIINKATPIPLKSDAVPKREILCKNYQEMSAIREEQLDQIKEIAPNTTPADIKSKRDQTFALYLYGNEITDNIESAEKNVNVTRTVIKLARTEIRQRRQNKRHLKELKSILDEEEIKIKEQNEEAVRIESVLRNYLDQIGQIYRMLGCDEAFAFDNIQDFDEFNLDAILQRIEIQLRHVIYTVYCWQEKNEASTEDVALVHGMPIVMPRNIPTMRLINPCPECSQVEARANPDVEDVMDKEEKFAKIKEAIELRSLAFKMHDIEDCPKPGSRAVLSKQLS